MLGQEMKGRFSQSLIVFGVFLCLFAWANEGIWASPQIRFDHTTFDFGRVIQGQKITHVFEFQNAGDETLSIKKVKAG